MARSLTRVGVIGAGPSGLATVAQLGTWTDKFEVIGFEKTNAVGGEWNYSSSNEYVDGERPTAMYDSLKANSDRYCSMFPGFDYQKDVPTWPSRVQMLQYMNDYADHLNIRSYFKFNCIVEGLSYTGLKEAGNIWTIHWRDRKTNISSECHLDAVVVCTGMFHIPVVPEEFGSFDGDKCHSCEYREPSRYTGKRVLVVGSGPSCCDIAIEVSTVATKVHISCSDPLPFDTLPSTVSYVPLVNTCKSGSVEFVDNNTLDIDCIILCTGYKQSYPFLDKSCGIQVLPEGLVYPLFMNIVHPKHRSLFFSGMHYIDAHIPVVSLTAKFIANVLLDIANLPSSEEMKLAIDSIITKYRDKGENPRNILKLGASQPDWLADVAKYANIEEVPNYPTFDKIICIYKNREFHKLRQYDFIPQADGTFKVINPQE